MPLIHLYIVIQFITYVKDKKEKIAFSGIFALYYNVNGKTEAQSFFNILLPMREFILKRGNIL